MKSLDVGSWSYDHLRMTEAHRIFVRSSRPEKAVRRLQRYKRLNLPARSIFIRNRDLKIGYHEQIETNAGSCGSVGCSAGPRLACEIYLGQYLMTTTCLLGDAQQPGANLSAYHGSILKAAMPCCAVPHMYIYALPHGEQ